jgi:hypothetical protein
MAKKHVSDEDDDFENDFENDFDEIEDFEGPSLEEFDEEDSDDSSDSGLDFGDDEDLDIIIEIDEEDLDLDLVPEVEKVVDTVDEDIVLSKHKIEGKHSLKYDSIFKGKKEEVVDEDDTSDLFSGYYRETIEVDKGSNYHFESIDNEMYIRTKLVKERVYFVLGEHTAINFLNNRRKPSRVDFNNYYSLLKIHLKDESFTNVELFNELSVYFSDNLFNMFKLLDNKWRNLIITELQDHIGKNINSKDITNRNIYEGTEIEFVWDDPITEEEKIITGVVMETDYDTSTFKVDSYENIYMVNIKNITRILNNTKFKYNLNKLNNIDFL